MTDRELMNIALREAEKSEEPLKCGVAITKDGEVVTATFNSQRKDMNATSHAEIKAIGQAGKALGQKDLVGCVVYCSCEPCTMCLSAFIFAKVDKVYYATNLSDVSTTHIKISSVELISKSPRKMELSRLV